MPKRTRTKSINDLYKDFIFTEAISEEVRRGQRCKPWVGRFARSRKRQSSRRTPATEQMMVAWYWWQQWCWNDDISCSTLVVFSDYDKRLRTNNYHKEESPVPDPLPLLLLLLVLLLLLLVESRHPCGNRILKSPASFTSPTLSEPLGIRWFCYHGYISQYIFLCLSAIIIIFVVFVYHTYLYGRQARTMKPMLRRIRDVFDLFWGNGGRNRTQRATLTPTKSCVTRAPLLYFIRSWVALSVSQWVGQSVRHRWHLSRSPLCATYLKA